jgi:hypothetical protein
MIKVLNNAAPKGDGAPEQILTMEMVNAGLKAFREWDPEKIEAAGMVCEVFFAMLGECQKLRGGKFR